MKIGDEEFEELPAIVTFTSKYMVDIWDKLGRPDSPLTDAGAKMMNVMIIAWEELYPEDAKKWYEERKSYKNSELSINEQVHKRTGRSLASYPYQIFMMMKTLFPKFKPGDRVQCMKLIRKFPIFKMANKV